MLFWNRLIMDCIISVVCLCSPLPPSFRLFLPSSLSPFLPSFLSIHPSIQPPIPDISISALVNGSPEFYRLSIAFPTPITPSGRLTQILELPEID